MDNEKKLGLCLNTEVADPYGRLPPFWQYLGLTLNSLCVMNGEVIGGGEDGVYTMDGNGTDLEAWFVIGPNDFSSPKRKRFQGFKLSGKFSDKIKLTHSVDEEVEGDRIIERIKGPFKTDKYTELRIESSHKVEGRYVRLKVENFNGSSFKIDEIIGYALEMADEADS